MSHPGPACRAVNTSLDEGLGKAPCRRYAERTKGSVAFNAYT